MLHTLQIYNDDNGIPKAVISSKETGSTILTFNFDSIQQLKNILDAHRLYPILVGDMECEHRHALDTGLANLLAS